MTAKNRRRGSGVLLAAVVLLAWAAPAVSAPPAARQTIAFGFGQQVPGAPSSLSVAIDYVNPDDPNAKPFSVETVVETLAQGARFDTSVPARCMASNDELMSQGASACPAASQVGGGEVDLDTGLAGPGRIVENVVTQFNNENELILLLEPRDAPGSRVVSRASISGGRSIVATTPPLPGGPPDGFSALKRVRLSLERIARGGRGYVTTPPACPPSRAWANTISFTYRDGVTQQASSKSPCRRPAPDRSAPRVRIRGVPRGCVTHDFRARVRVEDNSPLRVVRVRLDGKAIRITKRRRFRVRIPAERSAAGRHRVSVVAIDSAGNWARQRARFRRCG